MKDKLLALALQGLLAVLSPELVRELGDKILDFIEEKVADSETKTDDALLLPLVDLIRRSFGIEDND